MYLADIFFDKSLLVILNLNAENLIKKASRKTFFNSGHFKHFFF